MVNRSFRDQEPAHMPGNHLYHDILRRMRLMGIKHDILAVIANFLVVNSAYLPMYSTVTNQWEDLEQEK